MPIYAQISNDNTVVAVSFLSSQVNDDNMILISSDQLVSVGDKYLDGEFIRPNVILPKVITKLAFKQRLTQAERIAIRAAASSNPIVFDFLDILDSATFVDLQRADTIDGINAMEVAGLLAVGRATEILNAPVQDYERFNG